MQRNTESGNKYLQHPSERPGPGLSCPNWGKSISVTHTLCRSRGLGSPALLSAPALQGLQPWLTLHCTPGLWWGHETPIPCHAARPAAAHSPRQGGSVPRRSFELGLRLHTDTSVPEISDCHFLVWTHQESLETGQLWDLCWKRKASWRTRLLWDLRRILAANIQFLFSRQASILRVRVCSEHRTSFHQARQQTLSSPLQFIPRTLVSASELLLSFALFMSCQLPFPNTTPVFTSVLSAKWADTPGKIHSASSAVQAPPLCLTHYRHTQFWAHKCLLSSSSANVLIRFYFYNYGWIHWQAKNHSFTLFTAADSASSCSLSWVSLNPVLVTGLVSYNFRTLF